MKNNTTLDDKINLTNSIGADNVAGGCSFRFARLSPAGAERLVLMLDAQRPAMVFQPNPTLQPADLKIRAETPGEDNFCKAESSYGP